MKDVKYRGAATVLIFAWIRCCEMGRVCYF